MVNNPSYFVSASFLKVVDLLVNNLVASVDLLASVEVPDPASEPSPEDPLNPPLPDSDEDASTKSSIILEYKKSIIIIIYKI